LVIPKFDRMTRGLSTWLRIERVLLDSGGKIVSVADGDLDPTTPSGKFMLRQRAQFAEYELDQIRDRVTRWHLQRAHAGKPLVSGRRPFGYVDKQRSAVDPLEAAVIEYVAEKLLKGKSLRELTGWVNTVTTAPNGKPWRPPNLRAMLMSPGVAGIRSYKGTEVASGGWPAILDRVTWQQLRARLEANSPKGGRPAEHLLSGLVRCGRCGQPMHSAHHLDRKRGLADRRQYACRRRPGQLNCGKMAISAEPVELLVSERVLDRLSGKRLNVAFGAVGDTAVDVATAELAEAERDRDELEAMRNTGAIRGEAFLRMHQPAEERVDRARRALGSVIGKSVLTDLRAELQRSGQPSGAEALRAWWYKPTRTTDERRAVIQAVLREVVIQPSGPRMSKFDEQRVQIPREAWKV
jgi:site-specific DNA recombinase